MITFAKTWLLCHVFIQQARRCPHRNPVRLGGAFLYVLQMIKVRLRSHDFLKPVGGKDGIQTHVCLFPKPTPPPAPSSHLAASSPAELAV